MLQNEAFIFYAHRSTTCGESYQANLFSMQVWHQFVFICAKIKLYGNWVKIEIFAPYARHQNCLDKSIAFKES